MAEPRAFISFDYDHDDTQRDLFVGQGKNQRTPFNFEDWSSKGKLPQAEWEKLVEEKISKCNMVIVLVGRDMTSATGVAKEIAMAIRNDVPVFGVYVDGANASSALPYNLPRGRIINWKWDAIAAAIDQMMGEGKNA